MRTGRVSAAAAAVLLCLGALARAGETRAAVAGKDPNPHGPSVEECGLCHGPQAWIPARIGPRFDHAKSGFALEGAHSRTACRACHVSLEFSKAKPQTACVGCHQDVHQGELGQDCVRCHTARSFIDRARMARSHNTTRFPLSGVHLAVDCEDCHKPTAPGSQTFVNLRTGCVACHLNDYNGTTNPGHAAVGFPTDCVPCHSSVGWRPARVPDHDVDFFPIYSGTHRGRWTACSDCHVNASAYAQFECVQCHAHNNSAETASQHSGVAGYTYASQACYGCHPEGRK